MILLATPERTYPRPEHQEPVDAAIDAAFRVSETYRSLEPERQRDVNLLEVCSGAIRYAVSPVEFSDSDTETIARGTVFISTDLQRDNSSRLDMFNRLLLELQADKKASFDEVDPSIFRGEYLTKATETIFGMARLAINSPYKSLYRNFNM